MAAGTRGAGAVSKLARHWIDDILAGSALARRLGIAVETVEADRVLLRMPFGVDNVTVGETVHGGAIATLVDIAGAAASASGIGEEDTGGGATVMLTIAYLAPADGADLTAEARVVRRSRSQTVSDVEVRDAADRAIAKWLVTSRIFTARKSAAS